MNETKSVSKLITSLIAFALALGCAGTLYDANNSAKSDANAAVKNDRISYRSWDSILQQPKVNAKRVNASGE
jgi:hypothetical protein